MQQGSSQRFSLSSRICRLLVLKMESLSTRGSNIGAFYFSLNWVLSVGCTPCTLICRNLCCFLASKFNKNQFIFILFQSYFTSKFLFCFQSQNNEEQCTQIKSMDKEPRKRRKIKKKTFLNHRGRAHHCTRSCCPLLRLCPAMSN